MFQQRALVSSTDYSVTVPTHQGSRVDFIIDPGSAGDAVCDGIGFTAAIQTSDPTVGLVADSAADWITRGSQGEKNWFYGYFNAGTNTGPSAYGTTNFVAFPRGGGPQSANNFWDGEKWEWFNGRPPFDRIDQSGALDKTPAKHRMRQISPGLVARCDAVELRALAEPKARELRKHEPHPMRGLAPGFQFRTDLRHDRFLGADEAV